MAMPTPVLPNLQALMVSPANALKEIRNSLTSTLASFEAALPSGAPRLSTQVTKLPKVEEFFKGPGSMAQAMRTVERPAPSAGTVAERLVFE